MAVYGVSSAKNIVDSISHVKVAESEGSLSFKELITDALKNVNALEQQSNKITDDFIAGRTDDIHSVMIASEKASISMQFVMEVRNKVIEAYQEIMRMQI